MAHLPESTRTALGKQASSVAKRRNTDFKICGLMMPTEHLARSTSPYHALAVGALRIPRK